MKKNRTTRLVVLVLFLAIVTAVIISGTFAKYTESATGSGTAEIAKWSFTANGLDSFARTDGVTAEMIAEEKLAPGTSGSFSTTVDCTGCEVSVDYKVVISNVQNKPTNLKFYSDDAFANEITVNAEGEFVVEGTIAANAATKTAAVPVYWKWAYESGSDDVDTTEGKAAVDMTFDIAVVGTQSNPNA